MSSKTHQTIESRKSRAIWFVRFAIGLVFIVNVWCALGFIFDAETYVGAFELDGLPGRIAVQAFGILFLMWNATYPPVIWNPITHSYLFQVVLLQQAIGFIGEVWLWLTLPPNHATLAATGWRFIVFDGLGFVIMFLAFRWSRLNATER